jgi:thymidine kinase
MTFFYATMSAGKSGHAIQHHYNLTSQGYVVVLLTMNSREGTGLVASRLGISAQGVEITPETDLTELIAALPCDKPHTIICDEAQFYSSTQIDYLAELADAGVDILAFGLMSDFRSEMFPGSKRLIELGAKLERIQTEARCWCSKPAVFNARVIDGAVVYEGPQVLVGDIGGKVGYRVLCRRHYRLGQLKRVRAPRRQP